MGSPEYAGRRRPRLRSRPIGSESPTPMTASDLSALVSGEFALVEFETTVKPK
jgi:hypothetical protein